MSKKTSYPCRSLPGAAPVAAQGAFFAAVLLSLSLSAGCTRQSGSPSGGGSGAPPSPPSHEALVSRGRAVYQTSCIACHNANPKVAGALGPEVHGSSKELLQARVVDGNYPEGYKPKRETRTMAPLPHLKGDIDALHAYLNGT